MIFNTFFFGSRTSITEHFLQMSAVYIIGVFKVTSLKFKLQNYWFSWDFTFMMYKSSWWKLVLIQILTYFRKYLAIWMVHVLQKVLKVLFKCFWVPRFCIKTRHVRAHPYGYQHGVSIQISINLGKKYLGISFERRDTENQQLAYVYEKVHAKTYSM